MRGVGCLEKLMDSTCIRAEEPKLDDTAAGAQEHGKAWMGDKCVKGIL